MYVRDCTLELIFYQEWLYARQNRNVSMGSPCLTPDAEGIGSASLINRFGVLSVHNTATPQGKNVLEVLFHLPWKKAGLLTELNAFTRSSETSTQSGG